MGKRSQVMEVQPEDLRKVLCEHWGFDDFRPGQREVVEAILAGRHVLGVMPTGAGKSLCYQLPALILPGLTLVVSPLIALMKDQVDQLRARGIRAAYLNSTLELDEQMRVLEDAGQGRLKLLYVAPERFRYEGALARLKRLPVTLFAVDEAHCISHWGHDFRPDYKGLGQAFRDLGAAHLAAFTATATSVVRRDIVGSLRMDDPLVMVAGFARENLHLSVVDIKKMADKPRFARALVRGALEDGGAAIVYCATRKNTEAAAGALAGDGLEVMAYHGGMGDEARKTAQETFQGGDRIVMVATNAFGMGVDKPDVRLVVHWDFPGSLDAYYQEVGRAGRDGARAWGVMLFTYADQRIHEFFIEKGGENLPPPLRVARAEAEREKLRGMTRWAYTEGCRHAALLKYFGDRAERCDLDDPEGSRCDRCAGSVGVPGFAEISARTSKRAQRGSSRIAVSDEPAFEPRTLTDDEEVVVQKALSAVARGNGGLSARSLARVLRGSKAADVVKGPLFGTKSFGILKELPEGTTRELLAALACVGCTTGKKPRLTPLGVEVMWRRATVRLPMPPFAVTRKRKKPASAEAEESGEPVDEALLRALKQQRLTVAKERGVRAFIVASNKLLERLARLPANASRDDWLAVKGVGENNVEPLREAFGEVLQNNDAQGG